MTNEKRTDRERAEDLALFSLGKWRKAFWKTALKKLTTKQIRDTNNRAFKSVSAKLEAAFAEREAEIRKEFESLSCSKCGNPWGDGWLPIETAPKDAPILAIRHNGLHFSTPIVVVWDGDADYPWLASPFHDKDARYAEHYFSDWMPLPAAPEVNRNGI